MYPESSVPFKQENNTFVETPYLSDFARGDVRKRHIQSGINDITPLRIAAEIASETARNTAQEIGVPREFIFCVEFFVGIVEDNTGRITYLPWPDTTEEAKKMLSRLSRAERVYMFSGIAAAQESEIFVLGRKLSFTPNAEGIDISGIVQANWEKVQRVSGGFDPDVVGERIVDQEKPVEIEYYNLDGRIRHPDFKGQIPGVPSPENIFRIDPSVFEYLRAQNNPLTYEAA